MFRVLIQHLEWHTIQAACVGSLPIEKFASVRPFFQALSKRVTKSELSRKNHFVSITYPLTADD